MKIIYSRQHYSHDPQWMFDNFTEEFIQHYEKAERGELIFNFLVNNNYNDIFPPEEIILENLMEIHDKEFLAFLKELSENKYPSFPDSFSNLQYRKKPKTINGLLGYYCTDMQTPFSNGTYSGILYSASAALTGAALLRKDKENVYAITRPPGHHAGKNYYGGFCYCNNAALAAHHLSKEGKTVLLDIDYHHGNGSQDLFFNTNSVFYISLHADPDYEYPYYTGYEDEIGTGKGLNFNRNFIIPAHSGIEEYLISLVKALDIIQKYNPNFIVISFGTDTYKDDPIGKFCLDVSDYRVLGEKIRELNIPLLIVQEGGYNLEVIGDCVYEFLSGIENNIF